MKRNLFLTIVLAALASAASAQSPNMMNYQAVARNASGNPLPSQAVGLRFTVHDGSASGTTVYQETQNKTTNQFGLFTAQIGSGTVVSGTFAGIAWGGGAKYLQVEMDPTGGTTYTDMGTDQLISVPYAMYSAGSGGTGPWTANGNDIYNNNTGNVGIGTATPAYKFDLLGTGGQVARIDGGGTGSFVAFADGSSNYIGYFGNWAGGVNDFDIGTNAANSTGNLNLVTQAATRMAITPTGFVGIGTNAPSYLLHLHNANSTFSDMGFTSNLTGTTNGDGFMVGLNNGAGEANLWNWENQAINIATNGTIRMYVAAGGNVGIGTTNPVVKLEVTGDATIGDPANAIARIWMRAAAGDSAEFWASPSYIVSMSPAIGANPTTGIWINRTSDDIEPFGDNITSMGTASFRWSVVYAGNGTIQTSDARMKKNIQDLNLGLSTVMQLHPVSYEWIDPKDGSGENIGFIAQEVEKVVPQAVVHSPGMTATEIAAATKAGKPIPAIKDPYGMKYSEMIPVLTKAIQEQQQMIDKLQKEVEQLRNK